MPTPPKPKKPVFTAQDVVNANADAKASIDYTQQYKKESKYDEGLLPGMDQEAHRASMRETELGEQVTSALIVLSCLVGVYLVYRLLRAVKRNLLRAKKINVSVTVEISDRQKTG